jgi:hypothetical protein
MLCEACEHARFPQIAAIKRSKAIKRKKDIVATPETGRRSPPAEVNSVTRNTPAAATVAAVKSTDDA